MAQCANNAALLILHKLLKQACRANIITWAIKASSAFSTVANTHF